MIRRPPRSTHCISSAASDVYKRQVHGMGKGVKLTKLNKHDAKDAKKVKREKGPNAIRKIRKPVKIIKEKDKDLLDQLNINIGDTLQQELAKLNIAAEEIKEEKRRKKKVDLINFLSSYGRDHDKKLIESVERSMSNTKILSRGQRKRLAQKEKVARRKLLAQRVAKEKGNVPVDLKPFKFKKPKDTVKNPSTIEKEIEQKDEEEKMVIGIQKKTIRKFKKVKRKSKASRKAFKEAEDVERFRKIMEIPQFVHNPIETMKEHVANTILLEEKRSALKKMAQAAQLIKGDKD
eukprot:TRINITY_DN7062_c0_g2_i2.p1 TRINITY_DN7062_c0_g2~~TRINITY_DN7062_c0_g2_i2.p1  ORF type:complete len:299 (-),score=129.29 TRINITY_DN7062_c0_g2_i2:26-898(-)